MTILRINFVLSCFREWSWFGNRSGEEARDYNYCMCMHMEGEFILEFMLFMVVPCLLISVMSKGLNEG